MDTRKSDWNSTRHPVEVLAEEFSQKLRNGESPSIEDYERRYPELASIIRQVFEPIAIVERITKEKTSPPLPKTISQPKQLGDFRIVREIGRGGMGIVYEAIQQSLGRPVALKVINALSSDREQNKQRFKREAEAAAGLHHTNIVQVYGTGEDQDVQYYAMQLIDGVTLNDIIEWIRSHAGEQSNGDRLQTATAHAAQCLLSKSFRGKSSPSSVTSSVKSQSTPTQNGDSQEIDVRQRISQAPTQVMSQHSDNATLDIPSQKDHTEIVGQGNNSAIILGSITLSWDYYRNVTKLIADVANALAYAHRQRILHRDIKPANLLLDREGTVWVTDFGLARRTDLEGATQAGEVLGTLRYMAPEQIAGQGDGRMDVYSLGVCLFEMLTLRCAFEAPKQRLLDPNRYSSVPSIRSISSRLPRDLDTIVQKACAVEPSQRYATAADLEADLRRFLDDRPILARKSSRLELVVRWAKRNPAIATLSALTTTMLVAIAAILAFWNRQQEDSLTKIGQLYRDAAKNLQEKSEALEKEKQANQRAEGNLQLATQAFDSIINNISSRGGSLLGSDDDVDDAEFSGSVLGEADVQLLETLLAYFVKLGEENEKDMRSETAFAQRRVGEIQQRIGKLNEAEASYSSALRFYESLSSQNASKENSSRNEWISQQISILNDLFVVQSQQGKLLLASETYTKARQLIENSGDFIKTQNGRFQLAKLLNSVGRISANFFAGRFARVDRASFGGIQRPTAPIAPPIIMKIKKEVERNREAIEILRDLVAESPEKTAYRIELVQALRDEVRLAHLRNERQEADKYFEEAVRFAEELLKGDPESQSLQYELAETLLSGSVKVSNLRSTPGVQPGPPPSQSEEPKHIERAIKICDELLRKNPLEPTFLSLRAFASIRYSQSIGPTNRSRAILHLEEAVEIYQSLVDRFPDNPAYSSNLIEGLMRLSRAEPGRSREHIDRAIQSVEKIKSSKVRSAVAPMIEKFLERRNAIESKREVPTPP